MKSEVSSYNQLTRDELIRLLEARDRESLMQKPRRKTERPTIKRIMSEVLVLLFNEEHDPIEKSMRLLLRFFDADWGYVAIFEKDNQTANFPCEVMSSWMEVPKNNAAELTCETIPWIINTVKSGQDIVLCDMHDLPPEASVDKLLLKEQRLKSMLIIPLTFHNQVQGFIGFDTVRSQRNWTPMEVEDMHLIASIFSILIERWQAESNLEASRKLLSELGTKFQLFFNNLPLGVELYDSEGYLIDVNDTDAQIFGSTHDQLIGINLFDNPAVPSKVLENIKKGKAFSFPLVYDFNKVRGANYYSSQLSDNKKYLQVKGFGLNDDEFGRIGYLLIISDNTEKQLKDEQTQNNLAILKAVLLSGYSIVGEYDIEKRMFFIDPVLNDHQSAYNNNLFNYLKANSPIPFEHLQQMCYSIDSTASLLQVIDGKLDHCSIISKTIVENDTTWIRINAQSHKAKGHKRSNKVICHITNITEEKLLEEKLYQAEYETRQSELEMQKVREADKLKSAFLANMSHEIRTPLNAIIGFSNIIAEADEKEEKEEYVKIINKNSDLLLRLITDILDFSKIESGVLDYSLVDVSLKEICNEQYQVHSLKMPDGVSLVCDFDALPDISICTDPRRVTQVISNLISNATKFTDKGSITLSYRMVDKCVLVEVTDTGIGISPENIDAIFERFVKINSFKQGTGLGLTICKTIIEALGGMIGVDSEPGIGSRFWFTLPYQPVV